MYMLLNFMMCLSDSGSQCISVPDDAVNQLLSEALRSEYNCFQGLATRTQGPSDFDIDKVLNRSLRRRLHIRVD